MEDSKLFSGKSMDAQTVARIGYRGLMTNKTVVIPGLRNKILVVPSSLSSHSLPESRVFSSLSFLKL
jgi:short-subunit dehydrogenase